MKLCRFTLQHAAAKVKAQLFTLQATIVPDCNADSTQRSAHIGGAHLPI